MLRQGTDFITHSLGNRDRRLLMGIAGQIHTDGTGHIIIYNGCYGTLGDSDVRLFKESQVTAGTDYNLTGNINEVVFVFLTDTI